LALKVTGAKVKPLTAIVCCAPPVPPVVPPPPSFVVAGNRGTKRILRPQDARPTVDGQSREGDFWIS
jgi:hypothetical protein